MSEHAVAILLWSGPVIRRIAGEVGPSQTTLDQIADEWTAANCGVRPVVRLLEHLAIPAYSNPREPSCEELQDGSAYGGPIGAQGKEQATVGRRRRARTATESL